MEVMVESSSEIDPLLDSTARSAKNGDVKRTLSSLILFWSSLILCVSILFCILWCIVKSSPEDNFILYFNDIHIDYEYVYTKSNQEHCHTASQGAKTEFIYGQYGCDTTKQLLSSFYSYLERKVKKPKLIIFGGDASCTWTDNLTSEIVANNLKNITQTMQRIYPGVPMIFTLGNGEYVPNYGTFSSDAETFKNISEVFANYLDEKQKATFLKGGYYLYDLPDTNLRFISLNSPLYSKRRETIENIDPYQQFVWLRDSFNTNRKIVLLFHIQPGIAYVGKSTMWQAKYIEEITKVIMERRPDYLLGAHTHLDMFMPFYNSNNLSLIALSNPAVSPQHDNNPAFRQYYFSYNELYDYQQHYFDIQTNPVQPNWCKEYKFSEQYHSDHLSQVSLKAVLEWIKTTSKGKWAFLEHVHTRGYERSAYFQCLFRTSDEQAFNECKSNLP